MDGIIYIEKFIAGSLNLFEKLTTEIEWDERMLARLTASFGEAYNYLDISYSFREMPSAIESLCNRINDELKFLPNNCLINYYPNGKSKMGFHSDQIDILEVDTGIVIISLGETRTLKFRKIENHSETFEYKLSTGSLIYMSQKIQKNWQHSIPKSDTENGRMSLTFRKIKKRDFGNLAFS